MFVSLHVRCFCKFHACIIFMCHAILFDGNMNACVLAMLQHRFGPGYETKKIIPWVRGNENKHVYSVFTVVLQAPCTRKWTIWKSPEKQYLYASPMATSDLYGSTLQTRILKK